MTQTSRTSQRDVIDSYVVYARYHELCGQNKRDDLPMYRELCVARPRVLEIGCGDGRVLDSVRDHVDSAVGVEISGTFLTLARERLQPLPGAGRLELMEFDYTAASLNRTFELVLAPWYVLNYVTDPVSVRALLVNARADMAPGALFVADLMYPKALRTPSGTCPLKRRAFENSRRNVVRDDLRWMDGPVEMRRQVFYEHGRVDEILTRRRYYSRHELVEFLRSSGYVDVEFVDGYDLSMRTREDSIVECPSPYVVIARVAR